ncbi:MAG: ankyrin repeat domain-containing protein [Candidatus Aminicenantes bacterium]|nr:ankyrin repeat domain-containing protein [Candidatus Aminicenantes bacterium]
MITVNKIFHLFLVLSILAAPAAAKEIHEAVQQGNLSKVKMLLENNPELLEARNENDKTPLHFAAQGGFKEIVEFLLEKGADVNAHNIADETPLHYASALKHGEVVDFLIARGAKLNSRTLDGSTPLHYAVNPGNSETIRILIEKGADIHSRNNKGLNPLDLAFEFDLNDIILLLISKGCSYTPIKDPEVFHLSSNVSRILFPFGDRSNIGVSAGKDGFLLIDTGFSRRAETKLMETLKNQGEGKIQYIINSHLHLDHAAANSIGGESATFINFQNLDKLAVEGIITRTKKTINSKANRFFKIQYSIEFNDESITIIPCAGIHSDTDLIIYLSESGVVHMGDLLISESFPSVGENVVEYMELLEKIIDIFPAETTFISGHGKDSTLEDVRNYQRMLLTTIEIVRNHIKSGKSVEQMRKENVLKDYDTWNIFIPFLNTDYWIQAVYSSYKNKFLNPET